MLLCNQQKLARNLRSLHLHKINSILYPAFCVRSFFTVFINLNQSCPRGSLSIEQGVDECCHHNNVEAPSYCSRLRHITSACSITKVATKKATTLEKNNHSKVNEASIKNSRAPARARTTTNKNCNNKCRRKRKQRSSWIMVQGKNEQ